MILATIAAKNADGEVLVVHPNRVQAARLPEQERISLRQAIEDWSCFEPILREVDATLRRGAWKDVVVLNNFKVLAPLPRTWALLDGSAFIQHVILVRKARGAEPPEDLYTIPLMYQGVNDNLLSPTDDVKLLDSQHGMDFEAEFVVVTDAVPVGTTAKNAEKHIKLVMLMNDVTLRGLIPRELATGFGFFHGKPPSSFSPFALTTDELSDDWKEGRVQLPIRSTLNGVIVGEPLAGEMHFSFFDLVEHAAKTRPLSAGTIIGSGTVSNQDESRGISCLAERRTLETIKSGKPITPFMKVGDTIEIESFKGDLSLFGKIKNTII